MCRPRAPRKKKCFGTNRLRAGPGRDKRADARRDPLGSCEQHGPHLPVLVDTVPGRCVGQGRRSTAWRKRSSRCQRCGWAVRTITRTSPARSAACRRSIAGSSPRWPRTSCGRAFAACSSSTATAANSAPGLGGAVGIGRHRRPGRRGLPGAVRAGGADHQGPGDARPNQTPPYISHAKIRTYLMLFLPAGPWSTPQGPERPAGDGQRVVQRRIRRQGQRVPPLAPNAPASGNLGTPSAASARTGQDLLHALTEQTVRFLTDFAAWPPMPIIGPKQG